MLVPLIRHRPLRPAGRPGHDHRALRHRASSVLVLDNGSSHRGQASIDRLQHRWPKLRLIHLPVHASWLNQVEIYFSVVQRKVVSPNDFHTLDEVEARLLDFQQYYEQIATPFEWKFTKTI